MLISCHQYPSIQSKRCIYYPSISAQEAVQILQKQLWIHKIEQLEITAYLISITHSFLIIPNSSLQLLKNNSNTTKIAENIGLM